MCQYCLRHREEINCYLVLAGYIECINQYFITCYCPAGFTEPFHTDPIRLWSWTFHMTTESYLHIYIFSFQFLYSSFF